MKSETYAPPQRVFNAVVTAGKLLLAGVVLAGCTEAGPTDRPEVTPAEISTSAPATPQPAEEPVKKPTVSLECLAMVLNGGANAEVNECRTLDTMGEAEMVAVEPTFPYKHGTCGGKDGNIPIAYSSQESRALGALPADERGAVQRMMDDPVVSGLMQHAEGGFVMYNGANMATMGAWYTDGGSKHLPGKDLIEICTSLRYEPLFETKLHYRTAGLHEGTHAWFADVTDMAQKPGNEQLKETLDALTALCLTDMRAAAREYANDQRADDLLRSYKKLQKYFETQNSPAVLRAITDVVRGLEKPGGFERLAVSGDEKSGCETAAPTSFIYKAALKRGYGQPTLDIIASLSEYYPDVYEQGYASIYDHSEAFRQHMHDAYLYVTESGVLQGYDGLGHAGDGLHETVASAVAITQINPAAVIQSIRALPGERREAAIQKMAFLEVLFRSTSPDIYRHLNLPGVVAALQSQS